MRKLELVKTKRQVFLALETMLGFYESYRIALKGNKKLAIKQTLKTYDDFYEFLQDKI